MFTNTHQSREFLAVPRRRRRPQRCQQLARAPTLWAMQRRQQVILRNVERSRPGVTAGQARPCQRWTATCIESAFCVCSLYMDGSVCLHGVCGYGESRSPTGTTSQFLILLLMVSHMSVNAAYRRAAAADCLNAAALGSRELGELGAVLDFARRSAARRHLSASVAYAPAESCGSVAMHSLQQRSRSSSRMQDTSKHVNSSLCSGDGLPWGPASEWQAPCR